MVKIRITSGVFGWNHGTYDLVKAGDPPIDVDEALAIRLVEQKGVAEYVTPSADQTTNGQDEPADEKNVPYYHIGMTAKELREIGAEFGLTFKQGVSKADMVKTLDDLFAEHEPEDDAPAFDAAEAVQ